MKNLVPADVPTQKGARYEKNIATITRNTGNLFLFAGDQKIEHLNQDFVGKHSVHESGDPQHMFMIAERTPIGAFATQLGLIARYGSRYQDINYIVKLNSKTNCIPSDARDPISTQLWSIDDVLSFQNTSGLNICGIGYTIYLGSEYEHVMLKEAAHAIYHAHQNGLVVILWIYPRGKYVESYSPELLSGAAGVAHALGADFVKLSIPRYADYHDIATAARAAGNTKVIISGGEKVDEDAFLKDLRNQLAQGACGTAVGRNLFQRSIDDAHRFAQHIAALVYDQK
jgi:fructose-bisphosphate aldolase / 6-deoxy-5-ketofructose 1-phosphate synthase